MPGKDLAWGISVIAFHTKLLSREERIARNCWNCGKPWQRSRPGLGLGTWGNDIQVGKSF